MNHETRFWEKDFSRWHSSTDEGDELLAKEKLTVVYAVFSDFFLQVCHGDDPPSCAVC